MGKDERLHLRLDPAARKKLLRACELTGLDEPSALRACVQAFIEHVEAHGGIWLPLAIVPKSEVQKHFRAAGENAGADAGGHSTASTRYSALPEKEGDPRLNEAPPKKRRRK